MDLVTRADYEIKVDPVDNNWRTAEKLDVVFLLKIDNGETTFKGRIAKEE